MKKNKKIFGFMFLIISIFISFALYSHYLEETYVQKQLAFLGRVNDEQLVYQYFLEDQKEDIQRGKELIEATNYQNHAMADLREPFYLKLTLIFFVLAISFIMVIGYVIYERRKYQKNQIYQLDCIMNKHYSIHQQEDALNSKLNELAEYLNRLEMENIKTKERMQMFVEDTAHQIKTPLTSLKIYAELSQDQKIKHQGMAQTERMENILDALIDMAKLEAHTIHFNFENNSLMDCIEQVMEDIQVYQKDKKVLISWQAEDVYFYFDELWLSESILNIVKNAVQCSKEDGKVEVIAKKLESKVIIKVKDQGPGFSEEEGKHLFDRFYSSNHTNQRKEKGMGIGLNIAYEVVKAHHGHLLAISRMDGAEFVMELPLNLGKEKWESSLNRKVDDL